MFTDDFSIPETQAAVVLPDGRVFYNLAALVDQTIETVVLPGTVEAMTTDDRELGMQILGMTKFLQGINDSIDTLRAWAGL